MIYFHKYLYMLRAFIFPSSGVQTVCDCVWSETDTNSHTVHKTTHRLLRTTAATPSAEHRMQQHTTCTPEDGHMDARNVQSYL